MRLSFRPCNPRPWRGYYRRIGGDTTAFHVASNAYSRVLPYVYLVRDGNRASCSMIDSDGAYALADAVNAAKRKLGGQGGGSFLINEYGQVLVPAPDGRGNVILAGEIKGALEFEDPFRPGTTFSLADDEGLSVGDLWDRPYVGMWYNLSRYGRIYRMRSLDAGQMCEYPVQQDATLIRRLRSIRRERAVRFIVNPHGIVLTKVPPDNDAKSDEETWDAVYIGRIDARCWFQKEV